ncbi:hypothetical protein ACQCVK_04200 [Rossellomorea vietnamensis]|uniref:hypothetical protein n=1 Tax=Rossellomorea vietnamensis TaxID=218284 RepID=UPI003CE71D92
MNPYVKQMVEHRIKYLEMVDSEIEKHISHLENGLVEKKEELKKVRKEKDVLLKG